MRRHTNWAKMKPEYKPKTIEQKLGYLIEKCGEVLAATGKTIRWGLNSVNPELPPKEAETNIATPKERRINTITRKNLSTFFSFIPYEIGRVRLRFVVLFIIYNIFNQFHNFVYFMRPRFRSGSHT